MGKDGSQETSKEPKQEMVGGDNLDQGGTSGNSGHRAQMFSDWLDVGYKSKREINDVSIA